MCRRNLDAVECLHREVGKLTLREQHIERPDDGGRGLNRNHQQPPSKDKEDQPGTPRPLLHTHALKGPRHL